MPATQPVAKVDPQATFAWNGQPPTPRLAWLAAGLEQAMLARGHRRLAAAGPDARVVFHFVDPNRPRPYRRRHAATFVVAIAAVPTPPEDVLRAGYPLLVRALANLLLYVVDGPGGLQVHFVTLEQGAYPLGVGPDDGPRFFTALYDRITPLATSRLVIDNIFEPDLPPELWEGDERTAQIRRAGQRLAELNLLPAPFPIREILPPADFRHVQRLFGIGGLSYGNLSARLDATRFWMSASGVPKDNLTRVGEHILLVKGYDPARNAMVLSVPPHVRPRRVSVDAIEHWLIYREHPGVGAIIHVHAWMEGVPATAVNYPCGTLELAQAVANLVRRAPDPTRAVVGLKNHGLTITGPDMDDILARIEGRIIPQVPMS